MKWLRQLSITFLIVLIQLLTAQEIKQISEDLEIKQISDHCYIHISYHDLENAPHFPANGLVYINQGKAYIVDTPWTNELTDLLIQYLQDTMKVSVECVIPAHWHEDCMGGLELVHNMGIKSYAYQLTAEICKEKNLPIPKITFQDSLIIGSENELLLKYLGPGHTEDNIVVYIPSEKILFAGCMAKALNWNSLGFTGDANVPKWPETLRKVLYTFPEAKIVIPGHGDFSGINILKHTLSLFK
ncbi:MAG: subclass B1 metallo-beta-lactamase [Calditrichaceae bacterium]|jgi:metallo-beta-lactamase class B